MAIVTLEAKEREAGKKATRAIRNADEVPCVLYGHDVEAVSFRVQELDMRQLIYTNEFSLIDLNLGEQTWRCILKNVDFHPTTDRPIHADFQVLVAGETLTLTVPVHYSGSCIGVLNGGVTQTFANEISITCLPRDIPDHIKLDISNLDIGDSILVRDLDFEELIFNVPEDQTLISIIRPREIEIEEEEVDLEGEEGEELAEGEASEDAEGTSDEG